MDLDGLGLEYLWNQSRLQCLCLLRADSLYREEDDLFIHMRNQVFGWRINNEIMIWVLDE